MYINDMKVGRKSKILLFIIVLCNGFLFVYDVDGEETHSVVRLDRTLKCISKFKLFPINLNFTILNWTFKFLKTDVILKINQFLLRKF